MRLAERCSWLLRFTSPLRDETYTYGNTSASPVVSAQLAQLGRTSSFGACVSRKQYDATVGTDGLQ